MFFMDLPWISWTLEHQAGERLLSVISNEMPLMSFDHGHAGSGGWATVRTGTPPLTRSVITLCRRVYADTPIGNLATAAASLIGPFQASLFHAKPFFRARSGVAGCLSATCVVKKQLMLCGTVI